MIRNGATYKTEHPIIVKYREIVVGKYYADLFVDDVVVVELEVAKKYNADDEA